jgi:hypothetical protein
MCGMNLKICQVDNLAMAESKGTVVLAYSGESGAHPPLPDRSGVTHRPAPTHIHPYTCNHAHTHTHTHTHIFVALHSVLCGSQLLNVGRYFNPNHAVRAMGQRRLRRDRGAV